VRRYMRRRRGWLAAACLVILIAIAMAPIAPDAPYAALVPAPALFAPVLPAAAPHVSTPLPASAPDPSPRPPRAPPSVQVLFD
jgi:hypothetical protein